MHREQVMRELGKARHAAPDRRSVRAVLGPAVMVERLCSCRYWRNPRPRFTTMLTRIRQSTLDRIFKLYYKAY